MASSENATSRRSFLKSAAAVSVAGGTIALVDQLTGGITRAEAAPRTPLHDEQYLVDGLVAITDNGVEVVLPPLYKYIITGTLKRTLKWDAKSLKSAQAKLEKVLVQVEANRPKTAAGLTVVVAWGLPYFRNFIKPLLSASAYSAVWPREAGGATDAVIDAIKFGSDPDSLILEDNEIMIMIRSDSPVVLNDVKSKLFNAGSISYIGDIINVTSVRSGFVGRGFDKPSIAKQLAVKAGVAGAASIPDASQLMMGFTSTQKAALGPDNIASFETLGLTTVRPGDYFSGGAAMHLSHLYEDLALWYGAGYDERISRMHSPRAAAGSGTVTLPNGPGQVSTRDDVLADAAAARVGTTRCCSRRPGSAPTGPMPTARSGPWARPCPCGRTSTPWINRSRHRRTRPATNGTPLRTGRACTSWSSYPPADASTPLATRWTASFPTARS